MSKNFPRRHLFWILPIAVVAIGSIALGARMMAPPPSDLDLALSKSTDHGLYIAELEADQSPVPVGKLHTWTVKISTPDGKPAQTARLANATRSHDRPRRRRSPHRGHEVQYGWMVDADRLHRRQRRL